jgi:hypothetical protein
MDRDEYKKRTAFCDRTRPLLMKLMDILSEAESEGIQPRAFHAYSSGETIGTIKVIAHVQLDWIGPDDQVDDALENSENIESESAISSSSVSESSLVTLSIIA